MEFKTDCPLHKIPLTDVSLKISGLEVDVSGFCKVCGTRIKVGFWSDGQPRGMKFGEGN